MTKERKAKKPKREKASSNVAVPNNVSFSPLQWPLNDDSDLEQQFHVVEHDSIDESQFLHCIGDIFLPHDLPNEEDLWNREVDGSIAKIREYAKRGPILSRFENKHPQKNRGHKNYHKLFFTNTVTKGRVELKAEIVELCDIFPCLGDRVRGNVGVTIAIEQVIEALVYIFRVRFTEKDINFLENYYRKMEPYKSISFAAIWKIYHAFKQFREVPMNPVGSKRTFATLNEEKDTNEEEDPEDIRPLLKSGTHQLEQIIAEFQHKVTSKNAELLENLIARLQETKVALDESIASTSSSS